MAKARSSIDEFDELTTSGGSLRALAEYGAEHSKPELVTIERGDHKTAKLLILPQGKTAHSLKDWLDEYLPAPERRKGIATLTTLDSLIQHVNRFRDADSVVFASDDRAKPSFTAVLDYHRSGAEGSPRFGTHRAHYAFPFSDEWKAWKNKNGVKMNQGQFAEFIEDRIADVLQPPPTLDEIDGVDIPERDAGGDFADRTPDEQLAYLARLLNGRFAGPSRLMELSRGLAVHATEKVHQAVVLETGEINIQYVAEHNSAAGEKVKVPNLFLIGIPVFHAGAPYRIAARLRYRLETGAIQWFYELYRTDQVFDHAFAEACDKVQTATSLPLLKGSPE